MQDCSHMCMGRAADGSDRVRTTAEHLPVSQSEPLSDVIDGVDSWTSQPDVAAAAAKLAMTGLSAEEQPLAAAQTATGQHLAAILGRHAVAETVAALTHQAARLIGPLHDENSGKAV